MRKKSHISLARYLVNNMQVKDLLDHKKAFYLGSILPDIQPSFLTKRHTIEETFEILIEEIRKITIEYDIHKGINSYYARHLGVITHYLSDYCTFPHNSIFDGSLKDHVTYEKDLKFKLREYVGRDEVQKERIPGQSFHTFEEIIRFINETHGEYLKAIKVVNQDIQFIIHLCYKVVDAILRFFELAIEKFENEILHQHKVRIHYSQA
ncbi:MAG: hypothetical protein K0S04_2815 [Herbinix sp.]|nr:hypothetical protein [Herbinix sp.]